MSPPSTIAHYKITSKLGEGGIGAVYGATKAGTRIAQATLGNEAGLYGAAYLPWVEK